MATNVPIPNLGDSISQATLLRWLKNDGDYVKADEPVAELETDKANVDLPATAAGILKQTKKAGETVKVGESVAQIDESAKPSATPAAPTPTPPKAAVAPAPSAPPAPTAGLTQMTNVPPVAKSGDLEDLNPSVRPLLVEHNLDPKKIPGTGPHGRLLKEDVLKYLDQRGSQSNGQPAATIAPIPAQPAPAPIEPPQPQLQSERQPVAPPTAARASKPTTDGPIVYGPTGEARVAMSKIRKRIATNLVQAQQTAAILTTFNEVDLSAIMELRSKYKEKFEKTYNVGLGFMSFFARAAVLALREFPRVNAFLDGDDVIYHNYVNLGIAVSTDRGLAVPVLRNVEQMGFAKIESEIKRVAGAVRDGKLGLQELSGGTFTITNGGVFGSLLSTPILNPPQSAILCMHAIQKRPV
ncbi:MAG: Dihydrolipoyllysine-residue succinyltransferase component of 2-oxoglutarate dehydrogenase complex, partial [Phycisphaerales bacterium]|nr:Dihydrolipoyllysine-residue succinyltransferase component of 2-oxoglutarate dehydrogenase complex [Phycisphaerales bacterium]